MKTSLNESTLTGYISFGKFVNKDGKAEWIPSKEPIAYNAETLSGAIRTKIDCHITLEDGTVITVPAIGKTASQLLRMEVADTETGEYRNLRNGDVVTIDVPKTEYRKTESHLDARLGVYIQNDFHKAPYFNFTTAKNGVVAASPRGFRAATK